MIQDVSIRIHIDATASELPGILEALGKSNIKVTHDISVAEKPSKVPTTNNNSSKTDRLRVIATAMLKNNLHDDVRAILKSVGAGNLASVKDTDADRVYEQLSTKAKFYGIEI